MHRTIELTGYVGPLILILTKVGRTYGMYVIFFPITYVQYAYVILPYAAVR